MARRRRKASVGSFTDGEEDTARILKHTFLVERQRFVDNQRIEPAGGKVNSRLDLSPQAADDLEEHPEETVKSVKSRDTIWLTIARRVIARHIIPDLFVRCYFATLLPGGKPPQPNMLNSDSAFTKYDEGREASRQMIRVAFRVQIETAETEMCLAQQHEEKLPAWLSVLVDDDISISSLFRYCLALKIAADENSRRFLKVAEQYKRLAALQYIDDPAAYDKVWGDWIPSDFREESVAVYEEVYGS